MKVHNRHLSYPKKYRPDIDGLRAVAILAVIGFHAFPNWVGGGFIGVDVFFVISGYLISTTIFVSLDRGTFSIFEFYARRIRRIFPALIVVLAVCFSFGWFVLYDVEYQMLGKHIAAGAGFVSNIVLWNEAGYFDNSADTKPLLHLWSLGIEEQFYIFWPLLLWFAWKRKLNLLQITIVIAIVSFFLNIKGIRQDAVQTFYSPQTRFWELLSGSLLAYALLCRSNSSANVRIEILSAISSIAHNKKKGTYGRAIANIFSFAGLFLLLYGFLGMNKEMSFPGNWALIPVIGSLLLLIGGDKAWINRVILSNRVAVWFGLISFPLYLWHWPLLSFARIIESEVPSLNIRVAALAISVLLAWLTYELVERPLRIDKHLNAKAMILFVLMAVIGYVGYNSYSRNGLPFRFISKLSAQKTSQLSYAFPTNNECVIDYPYATHSCFESEKKYLTSIALIGDSHMEALTHGFKDLFDKNSLRFNMLAIGKGGCMPFLNTDYLYQTRSGGCMDVITPAIEDVVKRQDVKWVILVGRHAFRFFGEGFGDIEKSNGVLPFFTYIYQNNNKSHSYSNQEVFELGLKTTIDEIVKSGKKVIFVHQLPELGFDMRGCLDGLNRFNTNKIKNCTLNIDVVMERLSPYRDSVNRTIGNNPNVFQYDPLPLVCNKDSCKLFSNAGLLFYRDDDHMSMYGAEEIAKEITDKILTRQ